ncbi:hypothetical protein Q5A_024590 [Serratia inhibens PRI-2C]|nr:hypothetical protein Q5A_024590 [Serratia inhibens PRI-2C]
MLDTISFGRSIGSCCIAGVTQTRQGDNVMTRQDKLPPEALQKVIHSFSLIYGSEVFLVLKDIWGLDLGGIQDVTQWMAKAIIRQAEEDAMHSRKPLA